MKYVIPLLLLTTPVLAQQVSPCGDVKKAYNYLLKDYGERPIFDMIDSSGRHLMVFANPETRSWTVMHMKDEVACGVAAGTDFQPSDYRVLDEKYKDKGPPT